MSWRPTTEKSDLNHPLQHIFTSLFLVAEVGFLLRHEDTVATVKLNVCPPASVAIIINMHCGDKTVGIWLEPGVTWTGSSGH